MLRLNCILKLSILLSIFLNFYANSQAQIFQWVDKVGLDGTGNDNGKALELDKDGNICVVGLLKNNSKFGEGANSITLNGYGTHDIFLAKYDNNGNFVWARRHGSMSNDSGQDLILDNQDNYYVTGYYSDTADFWDTTLISLGGADIFVMSTDNDGNFRWVTTFNGTMDDHGLSITLGEDSMIYVSGYFTNKLFFNNYSDSLDSYGSSDMFIAKLDRSGAIIWVKAYGSATDDQGYDIQYYDGRIYTTGYFKTTGNFGGNIITAGLAKDLFISCVDTSGVGIWVKKEGGNKNDIGQVLCVKDGYLYLFMESNFNITISGHPYTQMLSNAVGNIDGYLIKYDLNGGYVASRQIASKFKDYQESLYVDDRFVYTGGISEGNLHIEGADSLINLGGEDIVLIAFDHDLNKVWHKQIKNTQYSGKFPSLHDIDSDSLGNLYLTGGFLDSTYFDAALEVASGWSVDVYLTKLSPRPLADVVESNVEACMNSSIIFENNSTYNTIFYEWHFPGSDLDISSDSMPEVTYSYPGVYDYFLIVGDGMNEDSVYYAGAVNITSPEFINLGNDTLLCPGSSIVLTYSGNASFSWNTGDSLSSITVLQPGIYFLNFENFLCNISDTIEVNFFPDLTPVIPTDSTICLNEIITLRVDSLLYTSVLWSDFSSNDSILIDQAGSYFVSATDTNGCSSQSPLFTLSHYPSTVPYVGPDTVICDNAILVLSTGSVYSDYQWSNGSNSESITIDTAGLYFVSITDLYGCAFSSDTIQVTEMYCLIIDEQSLDDFIIQRDQNGIWISNSQSKKIFCNLFSIDGKLLWSSSSIEERTYISISGYSRQVLIMQIQSEHGNKIFKF